MSAPRIGRSLLTLTILANCVAAATAEQRTWTDNSGKFSVEAEFVAISNGKVVLKTGSGKTIRVPLERLSEADRRYGESREHAAQQSAIGADPVASRIKSSGAWVTVDRLRPGNPIVKVRFHSIYRQGADTALKRLKGLTSLEALDLSMRSINDAALLHLSGLTSLQKLDLSDTGITDAGLAHLSELTDLRSLNLSGIDVTDAGLVHLDGMTNLESLTLGGVQITDAGLVHLNGMTKLSSLTLGGKQITDAGLVHLKELTELKELRFFGPQIAGPGLVNFRGMTKLRVLYLNWSNVTDEGLAHLKALTELRELFLARASVSDAGLVHLQALKNLEELSLGSEQVTDAGLKHLQGLKHLRNLSLGGTQITDAGLVHFKGLTNLEWLWLDVTQVSGAGLEHLQGLKHLRSLSLGGTQISDAGLVHIRGLTNLEWLSLGGTKVTGPGLEHLQGLERLKDIDLTECRLTDAGLNHLKELTNLESLDLYNTDIEGAAVKDLRSALPDTDISWSPTKQQRAAADRAAEAAIAKLESMGAVVTTFGTQGLVRGIRLSGDRVTDATLEPIKDLDPMFLTSMSLVNTRVSDAGLKHLEHLTNLKLLDLTNAQITDDGLGRFKEFEELKHLHLSGCHITDAGLAHLEELKNLNALLLNRTHVTGSGFYHLRKLLRLRLLGLSGARVTDAGLQSLKDVKTLVSLDLSGTQVTDAGMEHLGHLSNLQTLFLLDTQVTDVGLAPLEGRRSLTTYLINKATADDDVVLLRQLAQVEKQLDQITKLPPVMPDGSHRKEFIRSLLVRAHSLEPENPKWAVRLGESYTFDAMWLRKEKDDPDKTDLFVKTTVTALDYFDEALKGIEDDGMKIVRLQQMAKLAYDAGKFERAESYGKRLLELSTSKIHRSTAATAVHQGNLILGRLALRAGNVEEAKRRLLAAGKTASSPSLSSFGPNMALAKELLEQGEREVVLEYFELCKNFWTGQRNQRTLQEWASEVEQGKMPDFGANLPR